MIIGELDVDLRSNITAERLALAHEDGIFCPRDVGPIGFTAPQDHPRVNSTVDTSPYRRRAIAVETEIGNGRCTVC